MMLGCRPGPQLALYFGPVDRLKGRPDLAFAGKAAWLGISCPRVLARACPLVGLPHILFRRVGTTTVPAEAASALQFAELLLYDLAKVAALSGVHNNFAQKGHRRESSKFTSYFPLKLAQLC